MDGIHRQIAAFLRRTGIGRAEPLLVAVSGGADSTALACALAALGLRLRIAHVHHGLRGSAADSDACFVTELGARLGIPVHLARVDAARRDGRSPEARARALRYAALESLRAAHGCSWTATAHTLEDQAETLLLRAVRGSSLAGLAGIAPADPGRRLLRPVLHVRREGLRAYLARRGQTWCEDASNTEMRLPRSRLRAEVLPALERVQPGAALKLAQLAETARRWAAPERSAAQARLAAELEAGEAGQWLRLAVLEALGSAERRALLAAWLDQSEAGGQLRRGHVERASELADAGGIGSALALPAGLVLFRDRDALWLGPAPGPRFPTPLERWLEPPREMECRERGVRLAWHRLDSDEVGAEGWPVMTGKRICVRSPRTGDVIRLSPGGRVRTLRALFARSAWSRRRRAHALVIEQEGEVVWVPGLARATPAHAPRQGWKLVSGRLSTPIDTC